VAPALLKTTLSVVILIDVGANQGSAAIAGGEAKDAAPTANANPQKYRSII